MQSRLDRYRDLLEENNIEVDVITRPQFVPEGDLLEIVEPYHAIVCSDDEITKQVIARAVNLKVISKWGVGINSIDLDAARSRGIKICNSPGAFSESCATMVFSYLMHFARGVAKLDQSVRQGKWEHVPGISLAGKSIGIIGVGNVGKAVAKRAAAFEMKVFGHDIKEIDQSFVSGVRMTVVGKEEIFRQSDFVILSPDLNQSSFHLVGAAELSLMKPSAYLINVSRGPVVDEAALIEALGKKVIKGAGLDVFEIEPLPEDSPLRQMDNVILTPHNSYNTLESEDFVHDNTINNLIKALKELTN